MKVPISWLKDYVDITVSIEELAERLTLAGLEVSSIHYIGIPQGVPLEGINLPPASHLVWDRDKIVLGAIRELAGQGTLLSGIDLVFGEASKAFVLHVLPNYRGFLLAILPPGAFIALGLLIAANNWYKARADQRAHASVPVAA